MGILADDVLAEESVDEAHDPDNADEDLVQHGELVAVLSTVLTLRPMVKRENRHDRRMRACVESMHGLINCIDTKAKCRHRKRNCLVKELCGRCLLEFIDWRYSQSSWYF